MTAVGTTPTSSTAQAIVARALCQSVAFPKMTASVEDLFSDAPGSAYIHIVPIEARSSGDDVAREDWLLPPQRRVESDHRASTSCRHTLITS